MSDLWPAGSARRSAGALLSTAACPVHVFPEAACGAFGGRGGLRERLQGQPRERRQAREVVRLAEGLLGGFQCAQDGVDEGRRQRLLEYFEEVAELLDLDAGCLRLRVVEQRRNGALQRCGKPRLRREVGPGAPHAPP